MKKLILMLLALVILTTLTACNHDKAQKSKTPVEIKQPIDNSVNGYRHENEDASDSIDAGNIIVEVPNSEIKFCGNQNSKKFHKITCSSVSKIKDENKVYFKTREYYLNNGYSACKSCNP